MGVKQFIKNRQMELNLENADLAALFGVECFAGEISGRGFTVAGYYV